MNRRVGFYGKPHDLECSLCHTFVGVLLQWVECRAGCIFCTPCFTKRFHDQLAEKVTNTECFMRCGETFSNETLKKYLAPVFYQELVTVDNEMDVFKKLNVPPDEMRAALRIYKLKPKNEWNLADPLDILYTIAEGTFLRMFKARGGQGLNRNFIKEIKYFENEALAKRFNESKRRLEDQGIMCKERLVFHGTPLATNVEPIFQHGLLLSKCTRFAHGYGIYFSEFPDISQAYGQNLLLCRVLVGRPYIEGTALTRAQAQNKRKGKLKTRINTTVPSYQGTNYLAGTIATVQIQQGGIPAGYNMPAGYNIPAGYNSKFVAPDVDGKAQMIVIDKEDQILPAFQIMTREGRRMQMKTMSVWQIPKTRSL